MERTNDKLAAVRADVETLIGWAQADYEHSIESGAGIQAQDDKRRVRYLERALAYLDRAIR